MVNRMNDEKPPKDFIKFNIENPNPAEEIFKQELVRINDLRTKANEKPLNSIEDCAGLAFSGGGIRSSTFNLGVLQGLSKKGWLKNVDILSTVSGGGYIGSSLTWLLHKPWEVKSNKNIQWTCDESQFPFGSDRHRITRAHDENKNSLNLFDEESERNEGFIFKNNIIRYLRQHGNYLFPGNGITFGSFLAAYLRGVILNLFVMVPPLALIYFSGIWIQDAISDDTKKLFANTPQNLNFAIWVAIGLVLVFSLFSLGYSFLTYWRSLSLAKKNKNPDKNIKGYKWRRFFEKNIRFVLRGIAILALLGIVPIFHKVLVDYFEQHKNLAAGLVGLATGISGLVSVAKGFKSSSGKKGGNMALWVLGGSFLLIMGLLIGAFHFAQLVWNNPKELGFEILIGLNFLGLIFGFATNLNMLSVHRYYRDRLMETFMPNLDRIFRDKWEDSSLPGDLADSAQLSSMCTQSRPYHIINTNVVTVDSKIPKYHGRGGDSFILSPLYCGSNVTGWRTTETFMNNRLTLPTAMAISGAAVNANTGVGGDGITRNRLASAAMRMLNLGLGYWAPNPIKEGYGVDLIPGFKSQFLGGFSERAKLIHLTDGGHFENLALYELLKRRLKVIICSDGGADENFTFEDFGNMVEKARVDFGITIDIDLIPMVPKNKRGDDPDDRQPDVAERAFAIGTIYYPQDGPKKPKEGVLIFLKTTFISGLPEDVVTYKRKNNAFPDQSTADQFFDEKQFEAYRALGFKATEDMLDNWDNKEFWPCRKQKHPEFDNLTGLVKKAFTSG